MIIKIVFFLFLLFTILNYSENLVYADLGDPWGQIAKILASDGFDDDMFGLAVAISGDTIVVGADGNDDTGSSSGSAYIFQQNQGGANKWGEVKKLSASDGADGDRFGLAVAISGDIVIVAAPHDSGGTVSIFSRNQDGTNNWGEVTTIKSSDISGGDQFGGKVAISGDTVIVGAIGDDDSGSFSGSAYIFQQNQGGANNWGQVKKITASDGAENDIFGNSVAISGDTVIVGATGDDDDGDSSGSAYIFQQNQGGADTWGQVKKITASDGAAGDSFGRVGISGDIIVVSAIGDDDNGPDSGSAYVLSRNQDGGNNWGEVTKISGSDGANSIFFGEFVGISGDTVVVSATNDFDNGVHSGSAYIFQQNQGGADIWGEVTKIKASDGGSFDNFGRAVSISDDTVIVGAGGDDDNGENSGSIYAYERTNVNCSPITNDIWFITSSCTLAETFTSFSSVIVQNNSILSIPIGLSLNIDFSSFNLTVETDSGVLIKEGAKITRDIHSPTPKITTDEEIPPFNSPITVFIDFGEPVIGFTSNDISVSGTSLASLGVLSDNGGGNFSILIQPVNEGTIILNIPENISQDHSGNFNNAATEFSVTSEPEDTS